MQYAVNDKSYCTCNNQRDWPIVEKEIQKLFFHRWYEYLIYLATAQFKFLNKVIATIQSANCAFDIHCRMQYFYFNTSSISRIVRETICTAD